MFLFDWVVGEWGFGVEVEAVAGFGPVVGVDDELGEGDPGGGAHGDPVERDEPEVFDEVVVAVFDAAYHIVVDVEEVAEEEGEDSHVEYGGREEGFDEESYVLAEGEVADGDDPHDGVDEHGGYFAADDELEDEEVGFGPGVDKLAGVSDVEKIGLDIAFDPSGSLPEPVFEFAVGFFEGYGLDDGCSVSVFGEAHAQVCVFGDIE